MRNRPELDQAPYVCLVTGASRGIGAAIAERLAKPGVELVIVYEKDADSAAAVAECARRHGASPWTYRCDVSSSSQVADLLQFIAEIAVPLRVVVNNAGIVSDALIERMTDEAWRRVLDVNLGAVFYLTRASIRVMRPHGYGKIINISSTSALIGNPGQANYAVAKAGVLALTRVAAVEAARYGIRVNAICPGVHETDMVAGMSAAHREALLERVPLGRMGSPADVAATVAFLAGSGSDYVTGQTLNVNGGLVM